MRAATVVALATAGSPLWRGGQQQQQPLAGLSEQVAELVQRQAQHRKVGPHPCCSSLFPSLRHGCRRWQHHILRHPLWTATQQRHPPRRSRGRRGGSGSSSLVQASVCPTLTIREHTECCVPVLRTLHGSVSAPNHTPTTRSLSCFLLTSGVSRCACISDADQLCTLTNSGDCHQR